MTGDAANAGDASPRRPLSRSTVAALAVLGLAIAFALYWFLLRTQYATVMTDVDPRDAADIAKLLDEKKIPYRLADGGQTVLVAQEQADKARVELLGSDLSMRGQVGFELFNQSNMGLTEFDQKINYMRALQGELARTILLLDGIKQVRVHIGLAERAVFAGEAAPPKASITLLLKPGQTLTESRVRGIQRLVAGAVPDLAPDAVAVLDGSGRVVSADAVATNSGQGPVDPATADLQARVLDTIGAAYPDMHPQAEVAFTYRSAAQGGSLVGAAAKSEGVALGELIDPALGTPKVTVRVNLDRVLDAQALRTLEADIVRVAGLHVERGDAVLLTATAAPPAATPQGAVGRDKVVAQTAPPPPPVQPSLWQRYWPFALVLGFVALALAWWTDRRRSRDNRHKDLLRFSDALQARLAETGERAV